MRGKEVGVMPCTTFLAGKAATYDGSTFAARNEDSGAGVFDPKKFVVVHPQDQPRLYRSVLTHVEIPLPDPPMRYTAMPNAVPDDGIWGAAGVNEENISMTATETITTNERVLAADPLVRLVPAGPDGTEIPGGIGEEDIVTLVLPYIHSAREGVLRLGALLETYGTCEKNGIAFQDADEVWWLETIGGHHWIARRVPDEACVVMPNQLGIDTFDLEDAFGARREHMCAGDLREFIRDTHLDLSADGNGLLNARQAFGSHSDADHVYNTPRAWFAWRCLKPRSIRWDGQDAQYRPDSDDIPWAWTPDRKVTPEDVKYILSSHFQGTPYDPYGKGDACMKGSLRPIGINRNNFLSLVQIRPDLPREIRVLEWIALASNTFNTMVPFYAAVERTPDYLSCTGAHVSTQSLYWTNRLIGALADGSYGSCASLIERYQLETVSAAGAMILESDREITQALTSGEDSPRIREMCAAANDRIAAMLREQTTDLLDRILFLVSNNMKNHFDRSDN